MVHAKPAHNTRLALRALFAPSGSAKHRSGFALCGVLLHHIFAALQNLRFRLFGLQKRRQSKTLGEIIFGLVEKLLEN